MQNDLIVHIAFKIWSSKPVDNLFLCFFLCGTKYWEHSIGLCYSVITIYFVF